jgi:ATP-dependent RNA helicase DHX37/DHR1
LYSSSTLGTGKTATAQGRLDKVEDKEVRRAVHSRQRRDTRFADVAESDSDEEAVNDSHTHSPHADSGGETIDDGAGASSQGQVVIVRTSPISTRKHDASASVHVGSALQRNADGSTVEPRIMKRKGKGTRVCAVSFHPLGDISYLDCSN